MQCYTELTPPTAVTHAATLSFLGPRTSNLVVAKTSLLQIFEHKAISTSSAVGGSKSNEEHQELEGPDAFQRLEQNTKLVLVGEYSVSGTITALARAKTINSKSGGEALLIASKDAKLSLVEWDPENHRISTVSIHYYEGDKIQTTPFGPALGECDSYLTVDPSSRCAALKFGAKHLAILPFRQPGDDLVEGDYDPDLDAAPTSAKPQETKAETNGTERETPYSSSFVLPLTALDASLSHPIHLAFLHEYREPTFGIVSSSQAPSSALLDERKDILTYTVFTLDLEGRASTTLLSVSGLPYDIFRVIPLPLPVGGALLVGANELVHVDQAGKTNAVGVNEFAKHCSSFPMADQSNLQLRLEDSVIQPLDYTSGDMLIISENGDLSLLTFRIDGRSVSGLSVHRVDQAYGGDVLLAGASCASSLGRGKLFIGSEDGDANVLGWTKKTAQMSRKRSHAQMIAEEAEVPLEEEEEEDDEDADDDLYGEEPAAKKLTAFEPVEMSGPGTYTFRIHDTLPSLGPIRSVCFGKPANPSKSASLTNQQDILPPLSMLASVGRGQTSTLASLNREITPSVLRATEFPLARSVWSLNAKHSAPHGLPKPENGEQDLEAQMPPDNQYDQYMVIYNYDEGVEDKSSIYKIDNSVQDANAEEDSAPVEVTGTEFEGDGETLNMGTLAAGTRIVQVRRQEVRSYDAGKFYYFHFLLQSGCYLIILHPTKFLPISHLAAIMRSDRKSHPQLQMPELSLSIAMMVERAFVYPLQERHGPYCVDSQMQPHVP